MKNDGKESERSFEAYWTAVGHCQRLRDKRDLMGINGGRMVADFAKPSDFLVSARDVPLHYAEVKSTVHKTLFEFKCIQPGQSAAAQREHLKGANSYRFYIFSYQLGRWFVMTCEQYAHALKTGRRSLRFEELDPWKK